MKVITPRLRDTLLHNFLGGLAWGLGITVGLAIVGYILSFFASTFVDIPLVGRWLAQIVEATLNALQNR